MVLSILVWKRIAVFPVDVHKDRLEHHSSMGVVICLNDIFASSNLYHLFPLSEIMPLILKQILQPSLERSDGLIIHVLIVDICCSCPPGCNFRNSDRHGRQSIGHYSKLPALDLVVLR